MLHYFLYTCTTHIMSWGFRGNLYLQQCFVANVKCSTRGFVITTSIWRCKTRLLGNDVLFCFDWDQLTHHQYLHQHSQHINHINSCNQQNISPVGGSATRREAKQPLQATVSVWTFYRHSSALLFSLSRCIIDEFSLLNSVVLRIMTLAILQ